MASPLTTGRDRLPRAIRVIGLPERRAIVGPTISKDIREAMQHAPADDYPEQAPAIGEFLIVCLCAEWCGVCRDYADGFRNTAMHFPAAGFHWLDIEQEADNLGELDVENFPTLLIKRRDWVLFYGTMPPSPTHLKRILQAFVQQSEEECREYAFSSAERRCWQEDADLRRIGAAGQGSILGR